MQYAENVLELIGHTPLVKLHSVTEGIEATVLVKVEYLNPGGSVKDRIALKMIEEAEREGLLGPGGTVVEPTSGNTGVGLALVSQLKGYRTVFVTPDKVGQEKRDVLSAYGAELVVTPTAVDPTSEESYYGVADRLVREIPGAYQPNQFFNPAAPASHYETTGPEIWEDTAGRVTHVVMGAGTGGTITGTGRYLKEVSADRPSGPVRVIGADPSGSVYSGGAGRPYFVEGVGEDMWVDNYDPAVPDEVIAVEDAEALAMTRRLAAEEGLLVGGSSGLAVVAGLRAAVTRVGTEPGNRSAFSVSSSPAVADQRSASAGAPARVAGSASACSSTSTGVPAPPAAPVAPSSSICGTAERVRPRAHAGSTVSRTS